MNEVFLSYLWKFQLFTQPLFTSDGEEISVKNPGQKNQDAGPDFSFAIIKIGETIWAGQIEIHVKSSDWFKHNHQSNPKYKSVVLHVVYEDDLKKKRLNIPTLELKNRFDKKLFLNYQGFMSNMNWIPCETQITSIDRFKFFNFMSSMAIEKLEEKASKILAQIKENNYNIGQTFYEKLARNFGLKVNGEAFEMLAKSLPLKILSKHKNSLRQIEALLYGQAGLLENKFKDEYPLELQKEYGFLKKKFDLKNIPAHVWKFARLRPSNFPTIRISQFAGLIYHSSALLSLILETKKLENIKRYFTLNASEYWITHFNFDKESKASAKHFGTQATQLILINTVIPFLFVTSKIKAEDKYGERALKFLEAIDGEQNQIIRQWKKIGVNTNSAFFTQALLHLKKEYCDKKRCLDCQIGYELLKQSN